MWEHCDGGVVAVSTAMADSFDIHLDSDRAERLKARAAEVGLDPAVYALGVLDQAIGSDAAEDQRRWDAYGRTGDTVSGEAWLTDLRTNVRCLQGR